MLANTVVLSVSAWNTSKGTSYNTKFYHTFSRSKRESSSISAEQNFYISGMAGFQERWFLQVVSQETTQIISNSRGQRTLGYYEFVWKKWPSWCDPWKVGSFQYRINDVLEHLNSLFYHKKFWYKTLGLHKSAIFAYHFHDYDKPIGHHNLMCSFLSGIFNSHSHSHSQNTCLYGMSKKF